MEQNLKDIRLPDDQAVGPNILLSVDGEKFYSVFNSVDMMVFATKIRNLFTSKGVAEVLQFRVQPDPRVKQYADARMVITPK